MLQLGICARLDQPDRLPLRDAIRQDVREAACQGHRAGDRVVHVLEEAAQCHLAQRPPLRQVDCGGGGGGGLCVERVQQLAVELVGLEEDLGRRGGEAELARSRELHGQLLLVTQIDGPSESRFQIRAGLQLFAPGEVRPR